MTRGVNAIRPVTGTCIAISSAYCCCQACSSSSSTGSLNSSTQVDWTRSRIASSWTGCLRRRMTRADHRATERSTTAPGTRPATGRHSAYARAGRWHTSRSKYGGDSTGAGSDGILRIATNLLDVPAVIISLIYQYG
jgi:hypothetical protein